VALLTKSAAEGNKGSSSNINSIGTQGDGFGYVTAISDSARDDNRGSISDAILSEAVIHRSEG
jgi:hypothetical protein